MEGTERKESEKIWCEFNTDSIADQFQCSGTNAGDQENGAVNFLVFLPNTDRSLKAEVGVSTPVENGLLADLEMG